MVPVDIDFLSNAPISVGIAWGDSDALIASSSVGNVADVSVILGFILCKRTVSFWFLFLRLILHH